MGTRGDQALWGPSPVGTEPCWVRAAATPGARRSPACCSAVQQFKNKNKEGGERLREEKWFLIWQQQM